MIELRRADERGAVDLGWLRSRHTFSFGSYYDPRHMGLSALRVINDDRVAPGAGFDTHGHRDMEIISYVKHGTIEHADSMGNVQRLPAGEFQLMSAGTGVQHSEYNPSPDEPLEFLQIWIVPERTGLAPGYQQRRFDPVPGLTRVIAPAGGEDAGSALLIHQDASVYHLRLPDGGEALHALSPGRTAYVHVVAGEIAVAGERLAPGDGATLRSLQHVALNGGPDCEALLFDLP
jgi:redox-sensitive bicupin YhaK (pirin superfamily)